MTVRTFSTLAESHVLFPVRRAGSNIFSAYWPLGKPKLTFLVLCTTASGFYLEGGHDCINLGLTLFGTGLASFGAHSLNQLFEVSYDAQMKRTKARPLPAGIILPPHALAFALGTGACGIGVLGTFVNPLSAALASITILLYSFVYTPLKRHSWTNTIVGAVVGAIPPAIGQAAAISSCAFNIHSCFLPGLLFAWQFPHFCALSWNLKADYARAGYRMMSVEKPYLNGALSLGFSLIIPALCLAEVAFGLASPLFILASSLINVPLIYFSWAFFTKPSRKSSRSLFFYSFIHLPVMMVLAMYLTKTQKQSAKPKPRIARSDE